ncbi:MAG: sigma-54-dependent Fis family transcriptional regulator [Pirellulales bacterium]|nr:sigma-54-dependent Fis family transcriptional regulator [Pirellulales bacterium]
MPLSRITAATPGQPIKTLIIDDDAAHGQTIADSLDTLGYDCHVATNGVDGAAQLDKDAYEVIITDLRMDRVSGMEILAKAKEILPDAEVIVVTGHGTVQSAVTAMQNGAFNYLLKPLDLKQLRAVVDKAASRLHLRRANAELQRRLDEKFGFEGVIGNSRQMHDVLDRLRRIAPTDATVLIQGDTGTGKELVAQAIHQNSPRKNRRFVPLNCAALSENILESELFGHVRGAFTDAAGDRMGKFEYADGGTLFLDEVGDMPMPTQIKLLRVLESGEITRVGSNDPILVNVRILSATNRDLEESVTSGAFRQDLYHRLKVVTITLPRLVERIQDIPLLIDNFIQQSCKRHHKTVSSMTVAARRRLSAYDWPGNVRELRNVIESMVVVDYDEVLDLDDLPPELAPDPDAPDAPQIVGLSELVGRPLAEIERLFILETLDLAGGNREKAAKMLGIGERTLYRKIKDYRGE